MSFNDKRAANQGGNAGINARRPVRKAPKAIPSGERVSIKKDYGAKSRYTETAYERRRRERRGR